MNRCWKILITVLVVGALYYAGDRVNYWYRQQWHGSIPDMQELPPLDRSGWPKPAVAWRTETREVEAATPEGRRHITVSYSINSLEMKLVRIEPGAFLMGQSEDLTRETGPSAPVGGNMYVLHAVRLTKPYYLGAYEVSNAQFEQFDPAHKSYRPQYQRGPAGDNHPVDAIPWRRAQEFCRWLSGREGRVYRLPTEAEWEYACHAGTTNRNYWGDSVTDRTTANLGGIDKTSKHLHWADDGYEYTAPIGSFPPNPWGLYEMIGNAREWVADWYAPQTAAPAVDPTGPATGHCRVMKGASFTSPLHRTSCGWRDGDAPHDAKDPSGFRIVCEVE